MRATHRSAKALDEAVFGIVYGSISVMAVIMALHTPLENPGRIALVLFATVVALAFAKAFAEICQNMLASGEPAALADFRKSWQHSRTVILAANAPAAAFLLAALGLYSTNLALVIAQVAALLVLALCGARIGWRVGGTGLATLIGSVVTGGMGLVLSALKYLAH